MLATSSLGTGRRDPPWPRSAVSISVSAVPIQPPAPAGERLRKPTTATPGGRDAEAVSGPPASRQTPAVASRAAPAPAASHRCQERRWGPAGAEATGGGL